ncbi:hypothetical protein, partial [Rhodococcus sp. 14-2470-1b]|uniref:hypothetical protein n=1 Tax=Rhodococcus sp. 14-2470-1b TaxID=2023149 RepID=UPI001C3CE04F
MDDIPVVSLISDRVASLNERSSRRERRAAIPFRPSEQRKKDSHTRRPQAPRTYVHGPVMPGNDVKENKNSFHRTERSGVRFGGRPQGGPDLLAAL